MGGDEHLRKASRLRPFQRRCDCHCRLVRDEGQLGLGGAAHDGHHAVAHPEPLAAGARSDDDPGELHAGDVGGKPNRRRVQTCPLHEIGAVQPGGLHAHEQLARLRHGLRPFSDAHLSVIDHDCSHGLAL